METIFNTFTRKKEYLVCIDSDGCAMDTMDIKHMNCFGPCMVTEWGLEQWEDMVQKRWNDINLYTMTRGINRFLGLYQALKEVDKTYKEIEGLVDLQRWIETAKELSNPSLEDAIKDGGGSILRKVLHWSVNVNQSITALPQESKRPFEGVKACLEILHKLADVAIVSSANHQAIIEEWEEDGLLEFTDVICSQNAGSKAFCISKLLEKGYGVQQVLVVGDAPGDREAAAQNQVFFYPILVTKEKESWQRLQTEGIQNFLSGEYQGDYQKHMILEFEKNLGQ